MAGGQAAPRGSLKWTRMRHWRIPPQVFSRHRLGRRIPVTKPNRSVLLTVVVIRTRFIRAESRNPAAEIVEVDLPDLLESRIAALLELCPYDVGWNSRLLQ